MKIYTKTGDNGTSGLSDGYRTGKDSPIFDTLGEIDELSTRIGVVCTEYETPFLRTIQSLLHKFGGYLSSPTKQTGKYVPSIDEKILSEIEQEIDTMEEKLPRLTNFILPGVTSTDANIHLCRTQARKAERSLWGLYRGILHIYKIKENRVDYSETSCDTGPSELVIAKYLNRLSDYFFVLARYVCYIKGRTDTVVKL